MTPPDISTRHGFLAALHELVQPKTYLEIGVQHGYSLNLAHAADTAIGIDPEPLTQVTGNQILYHMTSDEFFDPNCYARPNPLRIDLAFIDGMHLAEYALRDFVNVERYCHQRSVVVFDDVLPRNLHEARRIPPGEPIIGDWAGDVWQVHQALALHRQSLVLRLADVQPTGLLVVTGFDARPDSRTTHALSHWDSLGTPAPNRVIHRDGALRPLVALQQIRREFYPGEEAL